MKKKILDKELMDMDNSGVIVGECGVGRGGGEDIGGINGNEQRLDWG